MLFRKLFATVFAVSLLLQSAFSSSPSLGSIIPRGAKRGTEVELNFNGDRLDDAVEIQDSPSPNSYPAAALST